MPRTIDRQALLETLRSMDPYEFEELISRVWEKEGWSTEVTQQSKDMAVDVEAVSPGPAPVKLAIQAKRYAEDNPVRQPEVQQYASIPSDHRDFDAVAVVTTGRFTRDAQEYNEINDINLVDSEELVDLIIDHGLDHWVERRTSESVTAGPLGEILGIFSGFFGDGDDDSSTTTSPTRSTEQVQDASKSPTETKPSRVKTKLRGFYLAVCVTSIALVGGFSLVMLGSTELIGALLLMVGMIGGPLTIAADAIYLRKYNGNYQPSLIWPMVALMTAGFAGLWYAFRRGIRTDLRAAFG